MPKFDGIIPPVITPFTEKGDLDEAGLRKNLKFLLDSGVHGIVVNGTTGEAESLTIEERRQILKIAESEIGGKVPLIAGTGAPSTRAVIKLTKDAKDAGADAALIVTPFYHVPTEEALIKHYQEVGESVDLPIIVYNIPQHTSVNVNPPILKRLCDSVPQIIAYKDSSGNMGQLAETIRVFKDKISILIGADDLLLPGLVLGAQGAIIAVGNVAPRLAVEIFTLTAKGDLTGAKERFFKWLPLARACTLSTYNFPAGVKDAVRLLGRPAGPSRAPLTLSSPEEMEVIRQALKNIGLL
jgi:4-hydroxy-tetrahydrodipicolinate synthase